MALTKKDFIKSVCSRDGLNMAIVTRIVNEFEAWIKESMLTGNDVRLEFGKFVVSENRYAESAALSRREGFHRHAYRPQFVFLQRFKEDVDKRETDIRQGKLKSNN